MNLLVTSGSRERVPQQPASGSEHNASHACKEFVPGITMPLLVASSFDSHRPRVHARTCLGMVVSQEERLLRIDLLINSERFVDELPKNNSLTTL